MDIPLNIDWRQILLHLFNFLILTGGLYFLLYNPIKKFIAKRESYYSTLDAETQAKLESARAYEEQVHKRLEQIEEEAEAMRFKTQAELEAYMAHRMLQANAQAEKIVADAKKTAEEERRRILEGADKEIIRMAKEATAKIFHTSTDAAFDQFLNAAEGDGGHE